MTTPATSVPTPTISSPTLIAEGKGGLYFLPKFSLSSFIWGPYYPESSGSPARYFYSGPQPKDPTNLRCVDGWEIGEDGDLKYLYTYESGERVYGPSGAFLDPEMMKGKVSPAEQFRRAVKESKS